MRIGSDRTGFIRRDAPIRSRPAQTKCASAVPRERRADDDIAAYRWATVFLIAGATLFYVPQVFAVEAASQEHLVWFATNLVSNANVPWALAIMWLSLAGVALVAAWFFFRAMLSVNRSMARRVAKDVRPRQAQEAMPTVTATR